METKHYDYGIINGDTVKLFNNSTMDIHPLHDDGLEDVNVEFCDNGILKKKKKKSNTISICILMEEGYLKKIG